MPLRRIFHALVLTTFLPWATSCSTSRTIPIQAGSDATGGSLPVDERVRVRSYTDHSGTRHDWIGTVQTAGADSLEFTAARQPRPGNAPPESHDSESPRPERRARTEILSVETFGYSFARTSMLVLGCVAGLLALAILDTWAHLDN